MASDFQLTNYALKLADIPNERTLITIGRTLLDSTKDWKAGKSFHKGTVKTYSREKVGKDGNMWHSRISEHGKDETTFDELWDHIGNVMTKAVHEKGFVKEIKRIKLVKQISQTQCVWTLHYEFPPPISSRVFTILQVSYLENSNPRTGIIVSVPIDLSDDAELSKLDETGVRGRYAAVERITESANGKTQWEMATSSTPGGSIPGFIAERAIPSQIAHDVPNLLGYVSKNRTKPAPTQALVTTTKSSGAPPTQT